MFIQRPILEIQSTLDIVTLDLRVIRYKSKISDAPISLLSRE